jgi:hypothetical protein
MTEVAVLMKIPADLLERAQQADLDMEQVFIEALQARLLDRTEEVIAILKRRLTGAALEEALQAVQRGERVLGLHAAGFWMSDDFDDPLPDEFWLGGYP